MKSHGISRHSGRLALLLGGSILILSVQCSVAAGDSPQVQRPTLQSFKAEGVVRELQPETKTVLVAHDPIANYMGAMTMPFRVGESETLAELRAGDRISFQLHVTEDQSWIDHVAKIGHSPDGGSKPTPARTPQASHKARHPLLDYHFTNELGQTVSIGQFRGQALAITFFFTRCPIPDFCPRLSRNFEEASETLLALNNAPTNWHFLSFSFDTEFDTPARLKEYAERYHYDPAHWNFLTGPKEKIAELAAQSDVTFQPDSGFFNHNFRTLIVDASGHLQMSFPVGGNLSAAIVSEILKAAAVTNAPPR